MQVLCLMLTSLILCNGLFLGEEFTYKGKNITMPTSFNITFIRSATIPVSLRLNSMCQVNSYQLANFNAHTNGSYASKSKRASMSQCTTVNYCDDNGNAGSYDLCYGTKRQLVDKSCIDGLWSTTQQLVNEATAATLAAAKNMTTNSVNAAINGINITLHNELDGITSLLTSQQSANEAMLMSAISDSAAAITNTLNANINASSQAINDRISNLVASVNLQAANTADQIAAMNLNLLADINAVSRALQYTNILMAQRVGSIADYLDGFVSVTDSNMFDAANNLQAVLDALQQLTVKLGTLSQLHTQGVDVSPLLLEWQSTDTSTAFEDATNNTYEYVATGMLGVYVNDDALPNVDINYPVDADVVGRTLYQCYEEGSAPVAPTDPTTPSVVVTIGSVLVPAGTRYSVYQYTVNTIEANCVNYPLAKAYAYAMLDTPATYYSLLYDSTSGRIVMTVVVAGVSYTVQFGTNLCTVVSSTLTPPKSGTTTYTLRPDSGIYINLVDSSTSMLNNITTDVYNYTYYYDSVRNALMTINATGVQQTVTYAYKGKLVETIAPGTNQMYVQHPFHGKLFIHRCVKLSPIVNTLYPVTDHTGKAIEDAYARVNSNSVVQGGGFNNYVPGLLVVPAYGANVTTANLMVRSPADSIDMTPDKYYYTSDVWCCNAHTLLPVMTVSKPSQCNNVSLVPCASAMFGQCKVGATVQVRQLTLMGRYWICPDGYTLTPLLTMTLYKSPRLYYCDTDRKHREPYGIELTYCATASIPLPGAGVVLETGIMAPGGLYPAECIFWTSTQGHIPLYIIDVEFNNQVVPVMLNALHASKIAYHYDSNIVVDEMNKLYGVGNSGYDCVTYEMDKILHYPSNCLNYDIPTYDPIAYFNSRVRSSGISKLLDYFVITPIPSTDVNGTVVSSSNIMMNFALKAGVDYESAYVSNDDKCPAIQVVYHSNPSQCVLSGWLTTTSADVTIVVAGIEVCHSGACVTSLTVADGAMLNTSIVIGGVSTSCSTFKCLSSVRSFVAYPVDVFSMEIQRPNQLKYINSMADDGYSAAVLKLVNDLNDEQTAIVNNMVQIHIGSVEANVTQVHLDVVDLNATMQHIRIANDAIVSNMNAQIDNIRSKLDIDLNDTRISVLAKIDSDYGYALSQLNAVQARYSAMSVGGYGYDNYMQAWASPVSINSILNYVIIAWLLLITAYLTWIHIKPDQRYTMNPVYINNVQHEKQAKANQEAMEAQLKSERKARRQELKTSYKLLRADFEEEPNSIELVHQGSPRLAATPRMLPPREDYVHHINTADNQAIPPITSEAPYSPKPRNNMVLGSSGIVVTK